MAYRYTRGVGLVGWRHWRVERDSLQKSLDKLIEDINSKNIKIGTEDFDILKEKFDELIDSNKIDFIWYCKSGKFSINK